ncbi:hypothetical protein D7035_18915, partial [Aquimarina sp. AD1]
MKRILLLFLVTVFTFSCGVKKGAFENLDSGNYDQAINTSIKKLRGNKNKKGRQDYVIILEEAFVRAVDRDINAITFLEKEGNPANLEKIYNCYNTLKNRQERIRPLLP